MKTIVIAVMVGLVGCAPDRVDELHAECLDVATSSVCQPSTSRPYGVLPSAADSYTLEQLCDEHLQNARAEPLDADQQARVFLADLSATHCFARCCPVESDLAAACHMLCRTYGASNAVEIESRTCLAARDACVAETDDWDTCNAVVRDPCLDHWGLDFSDIPRIE